MISMAFLRLANRQGCFKVLQSRSTNITRQELGSLFQAIEIAKLYTYTIIHLRHSVPIFGQSL